MTHAIRSRIVGFTIAICAAAGAARATDLPTPVPCRYCFIGSLHLAPNPKDPSGATKLLTDDLYFVDADSFVWKAGKGDITDGASIPGLFQPIIGGPFEEDYLPAAVIHDHYTDKAHRVRSWRDTAKVFYQAMLSRHVDVVKAKTMYFAVYVFGPHWDVLAKGVICGSKCIYSAPFDPGLHLDATPMASQLRDFVTDAAVLAEQPADYSVSHSQELADVQLKIQEAEVRGEPLSLREIERMASLAHGENVFLSTQAR